MAKITTKIVLNEKDLKEIVAREYNLELSQTTIRIDKFNGDQREPSYTNIIIEGVPYPNKQLIT